MDVTITVAAIAAAMGPRGWRGQSGARILHLFVGDNKCVAFCYLALLLYVDSLIYGAIITLSATATAMSPRFWVGH